MSGVSLQGRYVTPAFIEQLVERIAYLDNDRAKKSLSDLVEKNMLLGGSPVGFLFGGEFHSLSDKGSQRYAAKKHIHPDLVSQAREYIASLKKLSQDKQRLRSGLALLLRPCKDMQDIRDALPDSMAPEIATLDTLPRTRPEGWTVAEQPLQKHQLEKTLELVTFYTINRILY